jgi:hypothetical protein
MSTHGEFKGGLARGAGVGVGKVIVSLIATAVVFFSGGCGVGQLIADQPQQVQGDDD